MKKQITSMVFTRYLKDDNEIIKTIVKYDDMSYVFFTDSAAISESLTFMIQQGKKNMKELIDSNLIKFMKTDEFEDYTSEISNQYTNFNDLENNALANIRIYKELINSIINDDNFCLTKNKYKAGQKTINRLEQELVNKNCRKIVKLNNKLFDLIDGYTLLYEDFLKKEENLKNNKEYQEYVEHINISAEKYITNNIDLIDAYYDFDRKKTVISKHEAKRLIKLSDDIKKCINERDFRKVEKLIKKSSNLDIIYDHRYREILEGTYIKHKKIKKAWFIMKLVMASALVGTATYHIKKECEKLGILDSDEKVSRVRSNDMSISEKLVSDLLSDKNVNNEKKQFMNKIWSYLNNYNTDMANSHEHKKTKPAIKFDEIVAELLVYNNYNKEELFEIFDNYSFNSEKMLKAYKNSIKQEIQANLVEKFSFQKEELINSKSGRNFYIKYDKIMRNINIQTSKTRKKAIACQFYNELKKDFSIGRDNVNVEAYKLSILPIINSMNIICDNQKFALTKKQLHYFNNSLINNIVKRKLEYYEKVLENKVDSYSYNNCKNIILNQAKEEKIYNVSSKKRNIKKHKEYKKSVNTFK